VVPVLSLNKQIPTGISPLTQTSEAVARLETLLRNALALRVLNVPDPPQLPDTQTAFGTPARIAVLFSGGLDCTMLARIAHELIPLSEPIDLLNVAFENPRIHKPSTSSESNTSAYESCPDRITGRTSHAELQQVCKGREWRFIAIDVPYTETMAHRDRVIALMHPHNTEMDLSIAFALYFAARGTGASDASTTKQAHAQPVTTSARVLMSGLGADELFAGYTRHATAFSRRGHAGLIEELDLDIGRLGKRNLGRDDRVISNWGREARFPFLDEKLVAWALAAPVSEKCGFDVADMEDGSKDGSASLEPGKKVLRCLAWKMGMCKVASEKKRAVSVLPQSRSHFTC
jgi:asparagine synthetase B (glutamine-hydrolysing)